MPRHLALAPTITAVTLLTGAVFVPAVHAAASPPVRVSAGSATTGQTVQSGLTSQGSSPNFTFKTSTGTTLQCVRATAQSSFLIGRAQIGAQIGNIPGSTFAPTTCVGPFNSVLTFAGTGAWPVSVSAASANSASLTVVDVSIAATWAGANCHFDLHGSLDAVLSNTAETITLDAATSALRVSNMTGGCFGAITNGSQAGFTSTFALTANNAAENPIRIVGP